MNPKPYLLALAISISCCAAQTTTSPIGAKTWMLGGNSVTLTDVWSANNNPAASTGIHKTQYGMYSEQRFTERNIRLANLSMVLPTRYVHLGTTLNYYGYSVFNQQKIGISLSKKLTESFSLGVQLQYVSTFIEQYGHAGNIVLAAGIAATPVKRLRIGFVIFNPTQNRYGTYTAEKIPSYGKVGCCYTVSDKVEVYAEADQALGAQLTWRGGLYYKLHERLHMAVGAATKPTYYTVGTAVLFSNMKMDFASSFHEVLGFTPHLGVSLPVSK